MISFFEYYQYAKDKNFLPPYFYNRININFNDYLFPKNTVGWAECAA